MSAVLTLTALMLGGTFLTCNKGVSYHTDQHDASGVTTPPGGGTGSGDTRRTSSFPLVSISSGSSTEYTLIVDALARAPDPPPLPAAAPEPALSAPAPLPLGTFSVGPSAGVDGSVGTPL